MDAVVYRFTSVLCVWGVARGSRFQPIIQMRIDHLSLGDKPPLEEHEDYLQNSLNILKVHNMEANGRWQLYIIIYSNIREHFNVVSD